MAEPRDIGNDWVEMIDPGSGNKYFANRTTQVTQWTYPEDAGIPEEEGGDAAEGEGGEEETTAEGEDEWQSKVDPASGKTYYFNVNTRETSWVKPGSGKEWVERLDESSGKVYYVNMITRETQWTKPDNFVAASTKEAEEPATAAAEDETATGLEKDSAAAVEATEPAKEPAKEPDAEPAKGPDADEESVTNDRFAKLRNIRKQASTAESVDKKVAETKKPEAKEKKKDAAKILRNASIANFTKVEIPDVPERQMEDWAKPVSEGGLGKFNLDRKGLFNKRTQVEKILSFKKDLIKKSLLNLPSTMNNEAVQSYKNIVSFMGDRSTRKDSGGHASKLLKNTLHAPEELRDEIFCQIMKQVTNNPDPESTLRGWQLLAICSGTYPPSNDFHPFVMYFCQKHLTHENPEIAETATFVQKRIVRTQEQGPRINVPTNVEIQAVRHGDPVLIRVQKLDGSAVTVPVQSWTTVDELSRMVSFMLGLDDAEPYSIFEVSSEEEERVLDREERVLDIIAYWQKTYDDEKAKSSKEIETYKFMYKVRLFLEFDPKNEAAVHLFYIQGVFDVVNSRYPTIQKDCEQLAALQIQEKFGDFSGMTGMITGQLGSYCPMKYIDTPAKEQEMEDGIIKKWSSLAGKGYTVMDARANYLDYIGRWKIYGSTYFVVEPQTEKTWPSEIVLAINAKMILVVHPHTQEFLAEYPYEKVVTWGKSRSSFVLVLGNMMESHKIYFRTDQGEEINGLVQSYVDKIVGMGSDGK